MAMGGVGEAMLIGAAVGGGSAAITGGDPLKGALLGGLTGGAGAGISGALSGGAGALTGAGAGAGTAAGTAAGTTAGTAAGTAAGTTAGTAAGAAGAGSAGIPALLPTAATEGALASTGAGAAVPTSFGAFGEPAMAGSPAATLFDPTGLAQAQLDLNAASAPSSFQAAMRDPLAYIKANPLKMGAAGIAGATGARRAMEEEEEYSGPLSRFRFNPETYRPAFAGGGIADLSAAGYDRMVGEQPMYQRMASGGISDLGTYSDGGRLLRGPGDGMSDSIPGVIGGKRPARLATGEFVVPADVVAGLGNGATDPGAKQLYDMMDRVRQARTGTKKQGREINPRKYLPA